MRKYKEQNKGKIQIKLSSLVKGLKGRTA